MRSESEKAYRRAWDQANRERVRAHTRKWREANKAKVAALYADWVSRNPETKEAGRKRWRERNRERYLLACSKAGRKWRTTNPDKVNAKTARRRAAKRQAFVAWADKEKIAAFYAQAARLTAETGTPHEVDHIDPLCSDFICGLHNEFNLRVITAKENRVKHNHILPQRQSRMFA